MSWRACQCGNHTNQCIFSVKAFKRSGGITGGICLACQHHTEGSNCDQCIIGYYRDPNLTIGNEHACRECRCHPIGSIANQHCDRKTGQCPCKPGVVGQACNRCQEGYKQTRLPDSPCIKGKNKLN
ncbi:netrin 1 [Schistosoma bovis]|uniref:Laminin EGF-like domain-containing protein n=2 Tax=Schistosoma TaxID=6181 RepID=A0A183KPB3_9TREM|nr:netrin 1 [Schistosoma bovis]VDP62404.1 unnamed protein product [Schistosoma curassoni]